MVAGMAKSARVTNVSPLPRRRVEANAEPTVTVASPT